jgi:hypothetical protein
MKKIVNAKLTLNKSKISFVQGSTIVGGGETFPCPHTLGVCTSTLPPSVLGCDNAPSEFGAGGCTFEQEN